MSKDVYDVAVIGLGGIGSAAAWALTRAGLDVVGLDQYNPPHTKGSSHGDTRIIRKAVFEGGIYKSFITRSYELWKELEEESEEQLLVESPGIIIGARGGEFLAQSLALIGEDKLLTNQQVAEKYPFLQLESDEAVAIDNDAGYLLIEKCIKAFLKRGFDTRTNCELQEVQAKEDYHVLRTSKGVLQARWVVYALGGWSKDALDVELPMELLQKTLCWTRYTGDKAPLLMYEHPLRGDVYSFPQINESVKFARHYKGESFRAMNERARLGHEDTKDTYELLHRLLPFLKNGIQEQKDCVYSMTSDEHFIIDKHPRKPRTLILSGFSGHGYKYAPAIGEAVTQHITKNQPLPAAFALARFKK